MALQPCPSNRFTFSNPPECTILRVKLLRLLSWEGPSPLPHPPPLGRLNLPRSFIKYFQLFFPFPILIPVYRRVYASMGSVIRSLQSRFLGQKSTHRRNNSAVLNSAALVYKERRLIEPGLTGARINALAQPALVCDNTVLVYTEWVTFVFPQLTNVNRFSKGETTETATELACFMVSD